MFTRALTACGLVLTTGLAWADEVPEGFNTPIPKSIMTPDSVETSLGTLKFFDGIPDRDTVEKVYDNLDRMRAIEAFLDMVPMASVEALRIGMESIGIDAANKIMLYDGLMDSNSLFLTGNTDTVYAIGLLDLERDGPTVVEVPPGAGPGTVNDAYFRFVIDMGGPGPDRGKGGKYLILPPNYEGEIPEGYFVAESTSYINWLPLRGLLVNGSTEAPNKMWKEGLKVYPLSEKDNPPKMEFISGTGMVLNTVHANDETFYDEINEVIQREPLSFLDDELRGTLGSIGIEKGKAFEPDARMRGILKDAVAIANATARAIAFRSRSDGVKIFGDDSVWYSGFDGFNYLWLRSDGVGGRNRDARTLFYYIATVNTPAMVLELPGIGSQYALAASDSGGRDLDGAKTYSMTVPPDVPAANFWSVVVYDPQTRSMLQTDQPYPSKNDQRDRDMVVNDDGSITLWFGPEAPEGQEANWIQTMPGKSWFTILRLYGPLEPWFKREWVPGNIELIE